jgi:STE24 endopeptidase
VLFALLIGLCGALMRLPSTLFFDWYWERRFGLSAYTGQRFTLDLVRDLAATLIALFGLTLGLFGLMRRVGARWWLLLGLPAALLLLGASAFDPMLAQLNFTHRPLPAGKLRNQIQALLDRGTVPVAQIVVEDDSRATHKLNAFFMGQGPTRALVLSDVLLAALDQDEILAAVAHEAGHAREPRWPARVMAAAALLLFFFAADQLLRAASQRQWLGITGYGDVRALALLLLFFSVVMATLQPVSGYISRQRETNADLFGLDLTKTPEAFERLWMKTAHQNHEDPSPPLWVTPWLSHPPLAERLETVATWKNAAAAGHHHLPQPRTQPPVRGRKALPNAPAFSTH